MRKIVLASNNSKKIEEFKKMLSGYEIIPMQEIGFNEDIEETGETFFDNALIKADCIYRFVKAKELNYCVLADDSGLCVNALDGMPGVYSARYSGEHGNSKENRKKLLKELKDKEDRSAYFECCLVFISENGKIIRANGKTKGTILYEEEGDTSFGYDCLFLSEELKISFGKASKEDKNRVSHRAKALEELLRKID